eukprot:TRINITY_DN794_c0_g1_i3.p1 TRINITY_DN794_c0_g1~~TRINITY_DN794_c0_g1_i3.p1  ORF type:complete len:213 (+),score=88.36 TRINITY_DN794_c0_g1_i3:553-1191(+)
MSSDDSESSSLSSSFSAEAPPAKKKPVKRAPAKKKAAAKPTLKRKLKKDPNKPKRATTGYMFFMSETRPKILAENPGYGIAEVAKRAGALWNALTDAQKAPYNAKYQKDKLRYEEEMKTYVPDPAYQTVSKKRKKDPNAPKRNMNAYMHFAREFREGRKLRGESILPRELGKAAGEAYRALSPEQKMKFTDLAAADKERYVAAMAAYAPTAQ